MHHPEVPIFLFWSTPPLFMGSRIGRKFHKVTPERCLRSWKRAGCMACTNIFNFTRYWIRFILKKPTARIRAAFTEHHPTGSPLPLSGRAINIVTWIISIWSGVVHIPEAVFLWYYSLHSMLCGCWKKRGPEYMVSV